MADASRPKMKGGLLAALGGAKKKKLKKTKKVKRKVDYGPLPGEPTEEDCLSAVQSVHFTLEECSDTLDYHLIPSDLNPSDPDVVSILCISDTHGLEKELENQRLPKADILIHGGDFTNVGQEIEVKNFVKWFQEHLERGDFQHAIVIAGNHECTFEPEYFRQPDGGIRFFQGEDQDCEKIRGHLTNSGIENLHYLEDEALHLLGLNFYGSPWQPYFHNWAFNLPRGAELQAKWDQIPEQTDILITHGPPAFHGDMNDQGGHTGSLTLLRTIEKLQPQFHIFGHIHEAYGATVQENLDTVFINASTCTLRYRPLQLPIMFHVQSQSSCGGELP